MLRLIMLFTSLCISLFAVAQTKTYDDNKFAFDYPEEMIITSDGDYQTSKTIRLMDVDSSECVSIYINPGGAFPAEIDMAMKRNMKLFRKNGYKLYQKKFVTDELEHERVKYFDYTYPDGTDSYNRMIIVENPNYDIIILLSASDRKDVYRLYREVVTTFRPGDYYPAQMEIERYNMDFILNSK